MAIKESNVLLRRKNPDGSEGLLYPITRLDCVDGAQELVQRDELAVIEGTLADIEGMLAGIEGTLAAMQNNLFFPMGEWDGDITGRFAVLGMFYKVSENTIVPSRVFFAVNIIEADGNVSGEDNVFISDGVMTDLAELLGITMFTSDGDPMLVVADRAGTLPAAVVEQVIGVNPGMDIPYEAGTYVFGEMQGNKFLFIRRAEGIMPIPLYIDAKIGEIKALLPNQT